MPPKTISKTRERIGTILIISLAFFALVSAFYHLKEYDFLQRAYRNQRWMNLSVYRFGDQLSCLKSELTPDQTVGFIAQLNHTQNIEYYQLTQYFLAPILIDRSVDHPMVIGYVPHPDHLENILQSHTDLRIIKDCDNGIVLFANEP